ncbi:MAG: acyl-CoA dehydrogenase [Pseudomonadota bacterium]
MSLIVNRRDLDFYLDELFQLPTLLEAERYAEYDRDTITAVLDAAQALAEEKFQPVAAAADASEPAFVDGEVEVIPEAIEALDAFRESGFMAAGFDSDIGGMQLPWLVTQAISGIFMCANTGVANYAFLTAANANLLKTCGNDALKERFLGPLLEGRWFGTMCLSETQAGSSLGDIRTTAVPADDGSYRLSGSKMWISGGDHNLSENIVHMVLARTPDAPPGVRGISLFLVPKIRVNDDGSLGEFNNVVVAGLNHKMGQRGTSNCLLNFGESGDCEGFLVGRENEGLANMFHMMNEARIGVGLGSVAAALGGYLYALDYARERAQGRRLGSKDPTTPQVKLIEHADVRRLLMTQKVFVEGGQALIFYCASLLDRQKLTEDRQEHQRLAALLELLTPVAKSWPSEYCLEANKLAIQVLGGYGYTRDYPVERLYRDNRLNAIHEGAHAIHGLDILGRKVRMGEGIALQVLRGEVQSDLNLATARVGLEDLAQELESALTQVDKTVQTVTACSDPELGMANATLFLDAFGHVVVAWLWLRQALAAQSALDAAAEDEGSGHDRHFYEGKLAACRFFFRYELPKALLGLRTVASLDDTCIQVLPEQFTGS